ncbi:hypothetical protein [Hydrogenophaga sp. BPS33]|uniref:hypothetical protein n=1 Tax=Hydrogenophaga sp. BPS33 TaxID=2651974 RepID=UPI001320549A|nr:hypothetical protein [Hydrogenophaga sp. BPS33]QHE89305.1 hypothetical protein F9K07_30480 [Hydrogenophaga sp. BPS33]
MRVSQYNQFRVLTDVANDFGSLVASGAVVDVSASVSRTFSGASVAIEADTYERFVEWNGMAMREHGLHLEPRLRLMAVIETVAYLGTKVQESVFVCRAVDVHGRDSRARRALFTLRPVNCKARQAWVIEAVKL